MTRREVLELMWEAYPNEVFGTLDDVLMNPNQAGDTLFTFLVDEVSDVTPDEGEVDLEEVIRVVDRALNDVDAVAQVLHGVQLKQA
ncbi:MAG: hypothetical protein ACYCOU_00425 [Sulfobacillus sp.]